MGLTLAVVLAVDLVVLAGSWLLARRWIARRLAAPRQAAELGEEVGRLVTELNQAAERTVVLLEDRTTALNGLLAEADKRIGLLRREIERHEEGARLYGRLGGPRARAAAARAAEAESDGPAPVRRPDSGPRPPAAVAGDDGRAPAAAGRASAAAEAPAAEPRDARTAMRLEIGRLARAGLSPAAIAARVGSPLGEVELILSLEQRLRGS